MSTRLVRGTAKSLKLRTQPVATPDTDSGKRLTLGQYAASHGESWDKDWQFVEGPDGSGWASAQYLEPAEAAFPPPLIKPGWPRVPNGKAEIIALFGEPCKPICESGRVTMPASLPLSWAPTQRVTRFACHELLVPVFTSVFAEIHRRGFWGLLEDFGGCYNCREQRGRTVKSSTHSWGIGIDLNTLQNPLGRKPKMPAEITAIFKEHGFVWGGTWSRPDGMHYQYATGY